MGAAHTKGGASRNLSLVAETIGPFDRDAVARMATIIPFLQFKDTPDGVVLTPVKADHETEAVLADILDAASGQTACFQLQVPSHNIALGSVLCHNARGWTLRSTLTSQAVQAAYILLSGVAPTPAICAQLPWCSVPGFVDNHAQLVDSTQTFPVPTQLIPHVLYHVLQHGGSVDLTDSPQEAAVLPAAETSEPGCGCQ